MTEDQQGPLAEASLKALHTARALNVSFCLFQNPQSTLFTIDRHSGVVRIKAGEMLDYEKTKTHFVTVVVRVKTKAPLQPENTEIFGKIFKILSHTK